MKTTILLLALWAGFPACGHAATGHGTAALASAAHPTAMPAPPPSPAPRYDIRGIFDPAFSLVAYAIKVPHGWLMQQGFKRQWDGPNPNNAIFLNLTAPDKHAAITVLPELRYRYPAGPNAATMLQLSRQSGRPDPSMRPPLTPVPYLKQVLLPLLNQQAGAQALRLTGEQDGTPQQTGPQMQQANGYVEGVLPSGRKVRLTANVVLRAVDFGQGNGMYVWSVIPSIAESDANLAPVVAEASAVMQSLTPNPIWLQKDQALKARGNALSNQQAAAELQRFQANIAQTMQQFHQNVANQQARSSAINQNYQRQQRASGQVASAYADFMGDKTLYQNPETGERFKVQGSLGNVYQDAQAGVVLNSSQPLDGNHVNWQQLQQVELKNY